MNDTGMKYHQLQVTSLHGSIWNVFSSPRGLINEDIQYTLRVLADTLVKTIICVIGVGTNIINIVIFMQVGLKDSVTVAFFGLAFADLGFVFFTLVYQLLESLDLVTGLRPDINLRHLAYYINYFAFMCVDVSILITVFTSLQKCACVAVPFLFKKIFTYYLSTIVIVTLYVVVPLYYLPILITSVLTPKFDRAANRTRYSFPTNPLRSRVLEVFEILNRIILPFSSIVLVATSLIIMNRKLVEASKARHAMTNSRENALVEGKTQRGKSYLSSNELKVIEAVFLISAIFVACNVPDMVSFLASSVIPEFGNTGKYMQSYRLVRAVQNVLAVINSTVTIIVYGKYNTKYRGRFLVLFGCCWCHVQRD